jgi:uroporphyrinogen decarboxylase
MNHRERFYATIAYEEVDKPASWLGIPLNDTALNGLTKYFNVQSLDELKRKIDDDIYPIDVPYNSPVSNHIACAFPFAKKDAADYEHRTLTTPGYFEDVEDPSEVDKFPWPDPSKHISTEECAKVVAGAPDDYIRLGVMWSAHFQDACAAFGMQKALMVMLRNPKLFTAVIDRIVNFYLEANEIFYQANEGKLDAVLIGNDFGGQNGLMVSPRHIRKYAFPGTKKIIEQAKKYGLKVIHHSCGSIFPIIQDLVELGVDVIHPIQALAKDMQPEKLKKQFYGNVAFCGGVDHQHLLMSGTPEDIRGKIQELKDIFPTGLIFSPSHEAVVPEIPPVNIKAMFDEINHI